MVKLDHLVLTVKDIDATVAFYSTALGMRKQLFGEQRVALAFADGKINLHQAGREFEPKARFPTPGSADLCFITDEPLSDAITRLEALGIAIVEGPVARTGARGPLLSIYMRDPDHNLIELANRNG